MATQAPPTSGWNTDFRSSYVNNEDQSQTRFWLDSGQNLRNVDWASRGWTEPTYSENEGGSTLNPAFANWLTEQGYSPGENNSAGNNSTWKGIADKDGNIVDGSQWYDDGDDSTFWTGAQIAAAIASGGISSAAGLGAVATGAISGGASGFLGTGTVEGTVKGAAKGAAIAGAVDFATGSTGAAPNTGSLPTAATDPSLSQVVMPEIGTAAAPTAVLNGSNAAAIASGGVAAAPAVSGAAATTTATGGFWNGTDFSGTTAIAGSSNIGASAMTTSDWINLAGLGAGLYSSSQASSLASDAAAASQGLSQEWLTFAKQQYDDAAQYRDAAAVTSQAVSEEQLAAMKQSNADAADYSEYNKTTFRPLEQSIVADAQGYDTPERRQAAADSAIADVNSGVNNAREANARRLASMGINPESARSISALDGQDVAQASAAAGAAYTARQGVEATGFARQMDAASLGRNLPSSQTAAVNTGITAGNAAVSSATAPVTTANQSAQNLGTAYQGAIGANTAAGSLSLNATTANNQLWTQLGTTAGRYITSDVNMKRDIEPVSDEEALAATEATPVKSFKYDAASMAAEGIPMTDDMQGTKIGPMAQDVQKSMGDEAAPGGKKLDLITMNGINMKAVQAVNKKVDALGKQVGMLASLIQRGAVGAGVAA